jgi:type II secretion system protein J
MKRCLQRLAFRFARTGGFRTRLHGGGDVAGETPATATGTVALPNGMVAGFTLLELLIAVSIFVIVLAGIQAVFYTSIRLRNRMVESLESSLPVEQALQVMQHDLSNIVLPTNVISPITGVFFQPLQTTNPTNALPDQIGPDFYTTGGEMDGMVPWGYIEKIDYLLSSPTNGIRRPGRDLIRAVTRNLLPISQPAQPDEQHAILSGVQNLTFLYYDGTQWDTSWDTTQQTNLPLAIKVQIDMAAQPGVAARGPLELVVPIDVLVTTNPINGLQ